MKLREPINTYKLSIKLLAVLIFLCATFFLAPHHPVQAADTIPLSKVHLTEKKQTTNGGANQGGVITNDYYVYLDCSSDHCYSKATAVFIDNQSGKTVKKVSIPGRYLSGLSYKWGSDYISVVAKGNRIGCIGIKSLKYTNNTSKCYQPKSAVMSKGGTSQGAAVDYKGYTYKVSGYGSPVYLGVFKNGKRVKLYKINLNCEPEGVSIDGSTGDVYLACNKKTKKGRYVLFYRIEGSIFKQYTKQDGSESGGTNNDDNSSSGGSSGGDSASSNGSGGTRVEKYKQPESPGYDGTVETALFGTIQDDGKGCGTYEVLNLVIQILTIGIGITATIGIVVEGIRYLTAKDNINQATKAKRRVFDIVVGLALYVVIWALLSFLLPGGTLNTSTTCERVNSTTTKT